MEKLIRKVINLWQTLFWSVYPTFYHSLCRTVLHFQVLGWFHHCLTPQCFFYKVSLHCVCVPSLTNNHHHAIWSQHPSPPDKSLLHLMCLALFFNGHPISFHLAPTLQTSSTTMENSGPLLKVTVKRHRYNFVAQRHFFLANVSPFVNVIVFFGLFIF